MHPFLLLSDSSGKIYTHPLLRMGVSSLGHPQLPREEELIELPQGSTLFYLPARRPLGCNPSTNRFETVSTYQGKKVYAVAASLIPAYLRLYHPSYITLKAQTLPLWAYTACGAYGGKVFVAAKRIDPRLRQSPRFYNDRLIQKNARLFLTKFPHNRLYQHLAHCALSYNCLAAKNLFLKRWEAPLPTARYCNSQCIGCLSSQDSDCVAPHQRIAFRPTQEEIQEIMYIHLKEAREPIVSFGQGCEGEPLLETEVIAPAIQQVRSRLWRGTIHMNTNASSPRLIEQLCKAGIDSFRVSLNSVREKFYNLYFRPKGYRFRDVIASIEVAKKHNKFVSINLLVFPGFTDQRQERKSLFAFVKNTGIDMILMRNLTIDPDYYINQLRLKAVSGVGMITLIKELQAHFPSLKLGYFNIPKEKFSC
jgi:pyruvate-formate lyase-activating enzyme